VNFYLYALGDSVSLADPRGLDVWIEGPSENEPQGHLSINVGDPYGNYDSFSFGVNGKGFFQGEVYRDTSYLGAFYKDYYLQTSHATDVALEKYFESLLGQTAQYVPWRTCRNFAFSMFDWIEKTFPSQRVRPMARIVNPRTRPAELPLKFSTATDSKDFR
jgi:hypothetical protein